MKIYFKEKSPRKVMVAIQNTIKGRKIGEMLSFDLNGERMAIQVSQMGTSTLEFTYQPKDEGLLFELSTEKIAFAHKPFMGEMRQKLNNIITTSGGEILEA